MKFVEFDDGRMGHSCSPWAPEPLEESWELRERQGFPAEDWHWAEAYNYWEPEWPEAGPEERWPLRHYNRIRTLRARLWGWYCTCPGCRGGSRRYRFKKGGHEGLE